jgi:hypothetical protein
MIMTDRPQSAAADRQVRHRSDTKDQRQATVPYVFGI